MPPEHALSHPSVSRLRIVAAALGELRAEVVFIGGAVAPLLQLEPPFRSARVTKDVDAVVGTTSYTAFHTLRDRMRDLGFREETSAEEHLHRWVSSHGILFDLVPAGSHLGASGQAWDTLAMQSFVECDLGDGVLIRHVDVAVFLALKWAAYRDRGRDDPFASHDLEDIVALIASRPGIVDEVRASLEVVRIFVAEECRRFLAFSHADELVAANLVNSFDEASATSAVLLRLKALAHQ